MDESMRVAVASSDTRGRQGFAPVHKADAIFFPALLAFLWIGILAGFVPEIIEHVAKQKPPFLWIVHVHAAVFVGWLVFLTVQLSLVRSRNVVLHKRFGRIVAYWAVILVIMGLVTSVMVDRSLFGTARWNPQFLSIQLADLLNFAILLAFALGLRRDGASHKRLMLLATTAICNAGFGRWWAGGFAHWLGQGFISELAQDYAGDFLIVVIMILYDTATRGRPNRTLAWGAALVVSVEMLAIFLYFNPGWKALTAYILRP